MESVSVQKNRLTLFFPGFSNYGMGQSVSSRLISPAIEKNQ